MIAMMFKIYNRGQKRASKFFTSNLKAALY